MEVMMCGMDTSGYSPNDYAARLATAYSVAAPEAPEAADDTTELSANWSGIIVEEGRATGDGRLIEKGALRWEATRENPLLIRFVQEDVGAHDGAQVVGRIFDIERLENGSIFARGDFDLGSEMGREARRQVSENLTRGVSVDLDDVSFEVRVAADVFEESMLLLEESIDDEPVEVDTDEEGRVIVGNMSPDDELFVTTDARIRAATLVATPAFDSAVISLDEGSEQDEDQEPDAEHSASSSQTPAESPSIEALIAAAAPTAPPVQWFRSPSLDEPTAVQVTDDGRVFGHVATWDTCHIAQPMGPGTCVMAPKSKTDYAYFHTGSLRTKEGEDVAVGHITLDTGHAKPKLSASDTTHHYDHTGSTVADVRAGEDAHGIWIAGALRPGVTGEEVRKLRSSPLSGDWRTVAGNLEMVAALAVNVPGFPVPRPQGLVASGDLHSLTAAGLVVPDKVPRSTPNGDVLSDSDLTYLKRLADRGRKADREALAARVARSRAEMNRRKVAAFATRQTRRKEG